MDPMSDNVGELITQQQPHWQGTLFRSDKTERVRGERSGGRLRGLARWTRSDSSVYEGEFAAGKFRSADSNCVAHRLPLHPAHHSRPNSVQ